jgi:hypothetical protein
MNERDEVIEAIDCIVDSVMCGCEPVEQRQTLLGIFDRTMEMRDHYRQQREGLSSRADYWELRTRETKAELATAEAARDQWRNTAQLEANEAKSWQSRAETAEAERDALTNKCSDAESSIRALRGKVGLASVLNKAYAVAVKHTQTKLKSAERELAELERRIAEAPVAEIVGITDGCEIIGAELDYRDEGDANAAKIENIIRLPGNARVRLLVEQQGDKG